MADQRIFVYEHVVGGGGWFEPDLLAAGSSFLREGSAMLLAVAADLAARPGTHVTTLCDTRLELAWPDHVTRVPVSCREQFDERFAACVAEADGTLLIAPECGGTLANLADRVVTLGGRLVGPEPALIRLASDKNATCDWLTTRDIPTPNGRRFEPGQPLPRDLSFPVVLKPADGAGSSDVRKIEAWSGDLQVPTHGTSWRVEPFLPGRAASCAVLCGPARHLPLPACWQRLSDDGSFQYRGGRTPLPTELDQRARRLARRAAEVLPEPRGYVGFDLVLGDDPDGGDDRVIEVNPRLTTSYIGLRRLCGVNLAGAMLAVARGEPCELWFRTGSIEFDAEGRVTEERATEGRVTEG